MNKPTVVFDFDGVIHSYTSGWKGPTEIPDPPVDGIKEAIADIRGAGYKVVIVSSRCNYTSRDGKHNLGIESIKEWLDKYNIFVDEISAKKPPAIVYIDDRAICFDGNSSSLLEKINSFKPWNK